MFKSAKWCLFRKSVGQSSILTLLVANLIYPCWLNGLSLLGGFLGVPPMIAAAKQISDQEFCPFLVWIFPISSHFKPFQDEVAPQKPKTKKKMGGPDGRSLLHFSSALWRGRLVPVSIIFLAGHQRCPSHSAPSPGQARSDPASGVSASEFMCSDMAWNLGLFFRVSRRVGGLAIG